MHYWGTGWHHHMGWMSLWGLCGVAAIALLVRFGGASAREVGGLARVDPQASLRGRRDRPR
jgi:hypothetical protein